MSSTDQASAPATLPAGRRAVLPEASVERILHMVAGAPRCAYEIRPDESQNQNRN